MRNKIIKIIEENVQVDFGDDLIGTDKAADLILKEFERKSNYDTAVVMPKIAERETDIEYYKACEKIAIRVAKEMANTVFSKIDIDMRSVEIVFLKNGISFNKIEELFLF